MHRLGNARLLQFREPLSGACGSGRNPTGRRGSSTSRPSRRRTTSYQLLGVSDEERSSLGGEELQKVAETNVQSMALLASAQGDEGAMSRLEEARSVLSAPFTRSRYDALLKHAAISHHIYHILASCN